MSEFALIDRLRDRLGGIAVDRLELGIGDDAALLRVPSGHALVACCDTLIEGRHFLAGTDPADIAWKALAVNLSDLAAMGATPRAALLALSLPTAPDEAWIERFCDGWSALASQHDVALAGGDTTRGPVLSLTVTCLGEVPHGQALRRDGAKDGDGVYVSGTLGDAAAALALASTGRGRDAAGDLAGADESPSEAVARAALHARLARPTPRLALGRALRNIASSAIDVSDGLAADLRHVLAGSGVGARIEAARLPISDAMRACVSNTDALAHAFGGDDYELCFTVAPERERELCAIAAATGTRVTRIGTITAGTGLQLLDADGASMPVPRGWDHFA